MTILEIVVANAVMAALIAAVLMLFLQGSRALRRGDQSSEVVLDLQTLSLKLTRQLEESVFAGFSLTDSGTALCFPSPRDGQGEVDIDVNTGRARWRRFIIFYQQDDVIFRREVDIPGGSSTSRYIVPIEQFAGTGKRPLLDLLDSGKPVARGIKTFHFELVPTSQLLKMTLTGQSQGGQKLETVTLQTTLRLR